MSTSNADSDTEPQSRGQQSPLASRRARDQESETGEARKAVKRGRWEGAFPLGYKEGFSQWWSALPAAAAEHKVLSYVQYLQKPPTHTETGSAPPSTTTVDKTTNQAVDGTPVTKTTSSVDDPYGPRKWYSRMVPLSGKNRALNEFSVERVGETPENNLVILHGYGAGLGFFYKNFEGLSRAPGWQLYALDMLGMGRSSRPPFRIKSKERADQITEAETWFIDALEEWRIKKKLDRFTLLGHSLGGYLAVAYALKYPGHLNKLILASPVGIPEDPYAVKADMPEPEESGMVNEFTQDQETGTKKSSSTASSNDPPRKPMSKWVTYLWDANISPFSFVRWAGPLGPRLVSGWTSRRFSHLPPTEAQALHDYSYSLFRMRGSGEYALAYILAPGAFARSPLIRRIQGVGRQPIPLSTAGLNGTSPHPAPSDQPKESGFPVVLMYGENDWMDVKGGYAAREKILNVKNQVLSSATRGERERDNGDAKVVIIGKAGHHVYLDSPDEFNDVMLGEMKDVERREKRLSNLVSKTQKA